MLYELGLVATIAICGWIALDLLTATAWRRSALAVACMAVAAAMWATGDLLLQVADGPAEQLLARRINYVGICALPLSYVAVAAQAARPRWWRRAPLVLALGALVPLATYSCLFWDSRDWFVDYTTIPPRRGPVFYAHMLYGWALIVTSWLYFWKTARRLRRASSGRLLALAIGNLAPLAANFLHVVVVPTVPDPTPLLIGIAALCVRFAVIDSGLALYLPLARADVLEQVAVGIAVADLEGRVVDANRAARDLAHCRDPIGRPLTELVAVAAGRTDVVVEARSLPLHSAVAEVGSAVLLEDRTESRHAEQRLQLAARLESLGFLTAGIAHEVNNPLAFIRANLSQLEKLALEVSQSEFAAQLPDRARAIASDARELVADTQEGVERIAALVHRLKTFARNEAVDPGRRTPVDLGRVADAAITMASVGLPRGAIRRLGGSGPPVLANEGDLVQIALNLLVNAVQASEGGVDIEVEVAPSAGGVALSVHDRGTGIDLDALPHLFEPFYTTKPQGTGSGLGLSLSRDLAHRYEGRLSASNRIGGGATFTLWLPAHAPGREMDVPAPPEASSPFPA
jgi:signal transduction histidine kinase